MRHAPGSSPSPEPARNFTLHEALGELFAPSVTGRELWYSEHRDDVKARVSDFTKYQTVVKEMWDALGDEIRAGYSKRASECHMDTARCVTILYHFFRCLVFSNHLNLNSNQKAFVAHMIDALRFLCQSGRLGNAEMMVWYGFRDENGALKSGEYVAVNSFHLFDV